MKIELDKKQIDEVTRKTIEGLEKEVKSLTTKLRTRDRTIRDLRQGMDISKDRRSKIRNLADQLKEALEDGEWVDIDHYFD